MYDDNPNNRRPQSERDNSENFQLHIPAETMDYHDSEEEGLHSFSKNKQPGSYHQRKMTPQQKKEAKKAHKERNKIKGSKNRWFFRWVWLVMVLFAGIALAQYLMVGVNDMLAINRSIPNKVSVEIPKNADAKTVAKILYTGGLIRDPDFFKTYCKFTGSSHEFRHGSYELATNLDYEAIISHLENDNNRKDVVTIVFKEGVNVRGIAKQLEENGVCSAKDVLKAADSDEFDKYSVIQSLPKDSKRYYKLEGYLFPDSYNFYKGEDPKVALGKMLNNCQKKLTREVREKISASGHSVNEIMTLASIIQAEAASEHDMYMISGILQNRLRDGAKRGIYRLDCDSTAYYPYRTKSDIPKNEQKSFQSRYNTYRIKGLPPGPICNPGIKAIKAAISPAPESKGFYYFCHSKDGTPHYASTAAQHQRNLRKAGLA